MRSAFALLPILLLSACMSGPDYQPPETPQLAAGPFVSSSSAVDTKAPVSGDWWRLYNDPILDTLITDALAANTDVRVAIARLEKAKASLREARGGRLPQTTASAGGNYGRASAIEAPASSDREGWRVDTGLDISYELDLFGRVGRGIEAASGDRDAALSDLDAVRVIVAAETARAYADAASTSEQIAVAQKIVELLDGSAHLTARRAEVGLTTGLDTSRIAALRDQRNAEIPTLIAQRQAALFRLATLTGRAPADLPAIAAQRNTHLRLDQPIPVGDGARLIARRPDIRAAERRLAAATARIGVATAELYPRISLGASIGSSGTGLGDLFGAGPLRWLLGPLISWSFPNQQSVRARIGAAQADGDGALAQFDGSILAALRETETALAQYAQLLERRKSLQGARDHADRAVRIVRAQQREGQVDGLVLLDAERTFAETQAALVATDGNIANAQIDLFKALGGNWS